MIFVIFWAICAGLACMIAPEGKKAEAVILGFLLGPIGVIIVMFMKKPDLSDEQK